MSKYDFGGYATRNDLLCGDGRTIRRDAFAKNDGQIVPLVWKHLRDDANNVLGHALLENRPDGVYAYGVFNNTPQGKNAKELVMHGDVKALSIYANQLRHNQADVIDGNIREVSLVVAGANPGAMIDNVILQHGLDFETSEDEAIITTGDTLSHEAVDIQDDDSDDESDDSNDSGEPEVPAKSNKSSDIEHADDKEADVAEKTIGDIFNAFTEEQKNVVYFMIGQALEEAGVEDDAEHGYDDTEDDSLMHSNIFDSTSDGRTTLTHEAMDAIISDAKKGGGGSLKEAFLNHAGEYGIDNIEILFPDARTVDGTAPQFLKRRTDWVASVLGSTHHSPFSRIKSVFADITADEARARGYIKGKLKKEEVFGLAKRTTGPTTIYKKQKLDRDDVIDITDFDVIVWLKAEMRLMLDEEIARAILIGDGRPVESEDKIREDCVRPIWKDHDLYSHKVNVEAGVDSPTAESTLDAALRSRITYEGTGAPTWYGPSSEITNMLLLRDKMGRRLYNTLDELASALRVDRIVEVPVMENQVRRDTEGADWKLVGIVVNLRDYTVGADKGGEINLFDDFDIDYNQQKYLIETRISGALTKAKSAIVYERPAVAADTTTTTTTVG